MRIYRALGVTVLSLSLMAIGCRFQNPTHSPLASTTVQIVVTTDGQSGQQAQVGQTLQWQVLNPADPGFTVNFPYPPYPCGVTNNLPVSYGHPNGCTVSDPGLSAGSNFTFYYTIVLNTSKPTGPPPSSPKPSGPIPFSVVPCRGCATLAASSPQLSGTRTGAVSQTVTGGTDLGHIECDMGTNTAKVNDVTPDNGIVYWDATTPGWTVNFDADKVCTNYTFFSDKTNDLCTVDPNATGDHKYIVTSGTAGCKPGTGKLKTNK